MDADKDGKISKKEMLLPGESEDSLTELISFHDTNKDGIVTTKELVDSCWAHPSPSNSLRFGKGSKSFISCLPDLLGKRFHQVSSMIKHFFPRGSSLPPVA